MGDGEVEQQDPVQAGWRAAAILIPFFLVGVLGYSGGGAPALFFGLMSAGAIPVTAGMVSLRRERALTGEKASGLDAVGGFYLVLTAFMLCLLVPMWIWAT